MAEIVFIATTIFFAYVVFNVIGDKKNKPAATKTDNVGSEAPVATAQPEASASKTEKPEKASQPVKNTASSEPTPPDSLKNPKTGEIAKIPSNYAFAKRWIKEALVEEGLLEKVYKNSELDSAVNEKIQKALQDLRALEKYQ